MQEVVAPALSRAVSLLAVLCNVEVLLRGAPEESVAGLTVPSVAGRASSGLPELHKAMCQAVAIAVCSCACFLSGFCQPRDLLMVVVQEGAVQQFYSIKHKPYRKPGYANASLAVLSYIPHVVTPAPAASRLD